MAGGGGYPRSAPNRRARRRRSRTSPRPRGGGSVGRPRRCHVARPAVDDRGRARRRRGISRRVPAASAFRHSRRSDGCRRRQEIGGDGRRRVVVHCRRRVPGTGTRGWRSVGGMRERPSTRLVRCEGRDERRLRLGAYLPTRPFDYRSGRRLRRRGVRAPRCRRVPRRRRFPGASGRGRTPTTPPWDFAVANPAHGPAGGGTSVSVPVPPWRRPCRFGAVARVGGGTRRGTVGGGCGVWCLGEGGKVEVAVAGAAGRAAAWGYEPSGRSRGVGRPDADG